MYASARWAVLLPLSLALTACASMDAQSARAGPGSALGLSDDYAYVARVEQIARQRGVSVVWINPPSKPVVKLPEAPP